MLAALASMLWPFLSVLTVLAGKLLGSRAFEGYGYMMLVGEIYAAPALCIVCLVVLLLCFRFREPATAPFAVFGLLIHSFGLWAYLSPVVAG